MLGTAVLDDAAAWVAAPAAFALTALGVGLLVERAVGVRLPAVAILPLGACSSICLLLPVYELGAHGWLPAALLAALSAAGLILARRELRGRFAPGAAASAALAVYLLYLAPSVLSGHWTWNGYNFLNDTAIQFLLADQLKHHGVALLDGALSTRSESIRVYLDSGYPLGAHAHVAALATLVGSGVDVVYQAYLAMLATTAATALVGIGRRAGLGPAAAATAAVIAAGANLLYQYALQGSIKELAAFMCLCTAALLAAELLVSERPARVAVTVGIAGAAMVSVFSAAAAPYLLALALCVLVSALMVGSDTLRRRLPAVAGAGIAAVVVAALPTLLSAVTFARVSNSALGADSTLASTLGQLQRPLDLIQIGGIWFSENYGLPIGARIEWHLTRIIALVVIAVAAVAGVHFVRRRTAAPLLLAVPALLALAAVAPRASPYADAKLLALASPAVVFAAVAGALTWRGRAGTVGIAAAGIVALGVTASAAFAYHGVRLAPVDRMHALEQAVGTVHDRGWILLDEVEEFGKYYGRDAPHLNVALEAITPRPPQPGGGGYHLDLDEFSQDYVQGFDAIVTRNGPGRSRPPANFRRVAGNRFYESWEKVPGVEVKRHVAAQQALDAGGVVSCGDVLALAAEAEPGDRLVVAEAPDSTQMPVVSAPDRPPGWPPLVLPAGVVEPRTPGRVERTVELPAGTYDAWVRASTGRRLRVSLDGRQIGSVLGINTQGQWLRAGAVSVRGGRHVLALERPGGGLGPGDGATSMIGPVTLVRRAPTRLRESAPSEARRLCGKRWDWIELVAR